MVVRGDRGGGIRTTLEAKRTQHFSSQSLSTLLHWSGRGRTLELDRGAIPSDWRIVAIGDVHEPLEWTMLGFLWLVRRVESVEADFKCEMSPHHDG